jgi:hypothetical protein
MNSNSSESVRSALEFSQISKNQQHLNWSAEEVLPLGKGVLHLVAGVLFLVQGVQT